MISTPGKGTERLSLYGTPEKSNLQHASSLLLLSFAPKDVGRDVHLSCLTPAVKTVVFPAAGGFTVCEGRLERG